MKLGDSGEAFFVQETAQQNVREKTKRHVCIFYIVATDLIGLMASWPSAAAMFHQSLSGAMFNEFKVVANFVSHFLVLFFFAFSS